MTSVETKIQDAVLTAIEIFVIPRVKFAVKPAIAPSGRSVDGNVLELDQRDSSVNIEGLQLTASSRINSHTHLKKIDETRGDVTVEKGDLLVNQKNIDRQTYTHHNYPTIFIRMSVKRRHTVFKKSSFRSFLPLNFPASLHTAEPWATIEKSDQSSLSREH